MEHNALLDPYKPLKQGWRAKRGALPVASAATAAMGIVSFARSVGACCRTEASGQPAQDIVALRGAAAAADEAGEPQLQRVFRAGGYILRAASFPEASAASIRSSGDDASLSASASGRNAFLSASRFCTAKVNTGDRVALTHITQAKN